MIASVTEASRSTPLNTTNAIARAYMPLMSTDFDNFVSTYAVPPKATAISPTIITALFNLSKSISGEESSINEPAISAIPIAIFLNVLP